MIAIELWPIDRPKPYPRNARKITQAAIDKVAASLQEFGWRQPLVVDVHGVVVVGHVRLLAAQKLGLAEVPVHVADNLTPGQIQAYRLMDNRSHQETSWDMSLLAEDLADLRQLDTDLALTGFNADEIADLLQATAEATAPEEFKEYDENIDTEHECPKCGYRWSGKTSQTE